MIASQFLLLKKMLTCLWKQGSDAETSVQEPYVDVMELVLCS